MNPITHSALSDELEKIAIARPTILERPLSEGGVAYFMENKRVKENFPDLAKKFKVPEKGTGVIVLPSRKDVMKDVGSDVRWKEVRRHEMVHWLRNRRGERMGEPGVRGVLRTIKGEIAANRGAMKVLPKKQKRLSRMLMPANVVGSTRTAYSATGGVRKALMGGRLGQVLKAIRRK